MHVDIHMRQMNLQLLQINAVASALNLAHERRFHVHFSDGTCGIVCFFAEISPDLKFEMSQSFKG